MAGLFVEGNRVKFINTGDEGVITKMLGNKMFNVLLDDDIEIPAFEDDVVLVTKSSAEEAYYAPSSSKPKTTQKKRTITKFQGRDTGVFVAFDPFYLESGLVDSYDVYLTNDTNYTVVFSFLMKNGAEELENCNDSLTPHSKMRIGELMFDELNDSPSCAVEFWRITTMGADTPIKKEFKVKAKQFFKKQKNHTAFAAPVHLYDLITDFAQVNKKQDLLSYTKENQRKNTTQKKANIYYQTNNILERAEQPDEIDLHIEKLTKNHQKMTNGEKLTLQIRRFETFLDQAVRIGLPKVYAIHGNGKGKLKSEIASICIKNPYVKTFKNEHHPRYGFGATEIYID